VTQRVPRGTREGPTDPQDAPSNARRPLRLGGRRHPVSPLSLPASSDPTTIDSTSSPFHIFSPTQFSTLRGPKEVLFSPFLKPPILVVPSLGCSHSPTLGPVDASFFCRYFSPFCLFLFFFVFMFFRASCPLGTPHGMPTTLFLPTPVASFFGVSYFGCVYRCLHTPTLGPVDASLSCKLFSPFSFVVFTFLFSLLFYIYYAFSGFLPTRDPPRDANNIVFASLCCILFLRFFFSICLPPPRLPQEPPRGPREDPRGSQE
jgi:hypothetical protein